MKRIRNHLKISSCILILAVLCQSCVVYHKTPVSMEQAALENTKTKILLKDGSTEKFKYIARENDQYYGARQTGNGLVNIRVDADSISKVQVKNKTASVLVTVIPLAALTALVIAAANFSVDLGSY